MGASAKALKHRECKIIGSKHKNKRRCDLTKAMHCAVVLAPFTLPWRIAPTALSCSAAATAMGMLGRAGVGVGVGVGAPPPPEGAGVVGVGWLAVAAGSGSVVRAGLGAGLGYTIERARWHASIVR